MAKQLIHLSDGKKIVCGGKGQGVLDENQVTCPKCLEHISKKAAKDKDPLVWCIIYNRDLADGTDFQFTYEGKLYHLVSGGTRKIPRSLIIHLRGLHYPTPKYKQGEAGGAVKIAGIRHRFVVNELSEDEIKALDVKAPKVKAS